MTPKLQHAAPHEPGRLPTATVVGLDGGRKHARRLHRKKRRRERVRSGFFVAFGLAVLGGAAYAGYLIYDDDQARESEDRDERIAEIERERQGEGILDKIEQLEETPKFNGPGVPALGVGNEP